MKLRQFKWATLVLSSNGHYIIYSDADSPVDHTNACMKAMNNIPHDETIIRVNGFLPSYAGAQEAFAYCKERGLTVV